MLAQRASCGKRIDDVRSQSTRGELDGGQDCCAGQLASHKANRRIDVVLDVLEIHARVTLRHRSATYFARYNAAAGGFGLREAQPGLPDAQRGLRVLP